MKQTQISAIIARNFGHGESMESVARDTVIALEGQAGAFETVRQVAYSGPELLEEFATECVRIMGDRASMPGASLNQLDKGKVPGAPKLRAYLALFRKAARKGPEAVAAVSMGDANGRNKQPAKPATPAKPGATDAPEAPEAPEKVSVSRTFTPDDCIKALQEFAAAGVLTPEHLQTLQGIVTPAPLKLAA